MRHRRKRRFRRRRQNDRCRHWQQLNREISSQNTKYRYQKEYGGIRKLDEDIVELVYTSKRIVDTNFENVDSSTQTLSMEEVQAQQLGVEQHSSSKEGCDTENQSLKEYSCGTEEYDLYVYESKDILQKQGKSCGVLDRDQVDNVEIYKQADGDFVNDNLHSDILFLLEQVDGSLQSVQECAVLLQLQTSIEEICKIIGGILLGDIGVKLIVAVIQVFGSMWARSKDFDKQSHIKGLLLQAFSIVSKKQFDRNLCVLLETYANEYTLHIDDEFEQFISVFQQRLERQNYVIRAGNWDSFQVGFCDVQSYKRNVKTCKQINWRQLCGLYRNIIQIYDTVVNSFVNL
eukprot:TRINITY_DN1204_c0_g1_i14.p1 TRINITY_DN1204_c0_g1~~TRINITY_DN1204_c0_g1_i14.p1  ORF type:complete len:345 (-),score=24.03 TRINITY_DN1204_c0_g1_i14:380-1414(-)